MSFLAAIDSLRDAVDKILVTVGSVLLCIALLFIGTSPFDQLIFAICWFLGAILIVVGFVTLFGLLPSSPFSKQGLPVIFVAVSAFLLITLPAYLVVGSYIDQVLWRPYIGQAVGRNGNPFIPGVSNALIVELAYPNVWLIVPVTVAAICLFAAGLLLKLHDEYS